MATVIRKSVPKSRAKSVSSLSKPSVHFAAPELRLKSEIGTRFTQSALFNVNDNDEDSQNSINESEELAKEAATLIPEVYKTQGSDGAYPLCPGYAESTCLCSSSFEDSGMMPASKRLSYLDRKNWITTERLYELRKKAQDATKQHKTFTIRGCFYSIRKGLIQRGWVEKLDIHRRAPVTGLCQVVPEDLTQHLPMRRPGESRRQHLSKCERNIMSRFLEHIPIDFLWSARKEKTDWIDMARNPTMTINKFHKSPFTTKEGMCTVLRDFHWFFEEGKSEMYYPRSYNVWATDDLSEFVDDFRMTACISVLRYLCETASASGIEATASDTGKVPISCVQFAIAQCKSYIRSRLHFDIDEDEERVWDHDWDVFLVHHHMLTQEGAKFKETDQGDSIQTVLARAERVMAEVAFHWPQFNLDGFYNIWIVKPSNRCRGRGILLMNDVKKILNFVNPPVVNKGHFVVQKYIGKFY